VVTIEYGDVRQIDTPSDVPTAPRAPVAVSPRRRAPGLTPTRNRVERARQDVRVVPPRSANTTVTCTRSGVCRRLVRAFASSNHVALPVVVERNARGTPLWSSTPTGPSAAVSFRGRGPAHGPSSVRVNRPALAQRHGGSR
jgi:hypothetical protein